MSGSILDSQTLAVHSADNVDDINWKSHLVQIVLAVVISLGSKDDPFCLEVDRIQWIGQDLKKDKNMFFS